jgi:hypothetical protein
MKYCGSKIAARGKTQAQGDDERRDDDGKSHKWSCPNAIKGRVAD